MCHRTREHLEASIASLALGDVYLDGDEPPDFALLDDRCDRPSGVVQLAVRPPVDDLLPPAVTGEERGPQPLEVVLGHLAGVERSGRLADGVRSVVARDLLERGVDVLDHALGIGDEDGVAGGFDRAANSPKRLFSALQFGEVSIESVAQFVELVADPLSLLGATDVGRRAVLPGFERVETVEKRIDLLEVPSVVPPADGTDRAENEYETPEL